MLDTRAENACKVTVIERVYQVIRRRILDGHYSPEVFIREEVLAGELKVSRTPVREALRCLLSEGWIELFPHRGVRAVSWTFADVREVFELRAVLEPHGAQRAASRITFHQLHRLDALAEQMELLASAEDEEQLDSIARLNDEFHTIVMDAAESPRLQRLTAAIVQVPVSRRSFFRYGKNQLRCSMQHHRELVAALTARDGDWAAAVMLAHILAARNAQLQQSPKGSSAALPSKEGEM